MSRATAVLAGGAWVSQLVLQPTLDPTTHVLSACWQPWLLKGKKKVVLACAQQLPLPVVSGRDQLLPVAVPSP